MTYTGLDYIMLALFGGRIASSLEDGAIPTTFAELAFDRTKLPFLRPLGGVGVRDS